jgi:NAD dependent epimerase/dehydratase family enzyme
MVLRLLHDEQLSGPFNMTAPNPVTNTEFTRVLARTLHRPAVFIAPGIMLRLAMGERAALLLEGQRVLPANLADAGYQYKYPKLSSALEALLQH